MEFDAKLIARMEAHIDKNTTNGCWLSSYWANKNGQSRIEIDGKLYLFDRIILFYSDQSKTFEFQNGKIWLACHKCPTKNCVNPKHLEWGSHVKNNGEDKIRDGTLANGEKNGQSKLTEAQVLEIRREFATNKISRKELAAKYGVGQTIITYIINRKNWKHI